MGISIVGLVDKSKSRLWLGFSIVIAIIFAVAAWQLAFQSSQTIQDDARQHVFWMQRFNDRDLFKQDLITDYFSSVAPWGYKSLYWLANLLGLEPFLFNKLLPVILGTISTVYLFLTVLEICPVPFAGFMAALLFNQNIWMLDDLVSGTPRAFFYPLFLGFIYYFLRSKLLFCLAFIILSGLFYPQLVLVILSFLIINLLSSSNKRKFCIYCGICALFILGIYALKTSQFAEVIDIASAKQFPNFFTGGRNEFFLENPILFWLSAPRSGFFPREWQYVLLCSFGLCLPVLSKYRDRFSLTTKINCNIKIVWQILLASLLMFVLAHIFLFKLHLPSRYSQHNLRIIIALVDGIAIAVLFNGLTKKITKHKQVLKPLIAIVIIGGLLYPTYAVQSYPYRLGYVTGEATELYEFLRQQPKDILIASLSEEADFIPSLAQRSVLVAEEYSIPYHLDYYLPLRQRTKDLIQAQYSSDKETIINFINKYQIDFWLIDSNAFSEDYLNNNNWLKQFKPEFRSAIASLQNASPIILQREAERCNLLSVEEYILLHTSCLSKSYKL